MSRVNNPRKMPVMGMSNVLAETDVRPRGRHPQQRSSVAPVLSRKRARFGWALAILAYAMRNPLDSLAATAALVMAGSIINNALFEQNASHPAPIFGTAAPHASSSATDPVAAKLDSLAGTTPAEGNAPQIEVVRTIQAQLAARGLYNGTVDGVFGPRTSAAISAYENAAGMKITGAPSLEVMESLTGKRNAAAQSAAPAANSKMIAVQHVLAEQGFGPLKVDGVFGDTTREALKRFEATRGLPVKGELTAEILKELSAVSGVALN